VVIILLALGVFLLMLIFAGLAIDIAYMYNAKNGLQVAADASALAGAKRLIVVNDSTPSAFVQQYAREEAWKYACRNSAAGSNVYVQSKTQNGNCNNPPGELNEGNAAGGDIVVGNWSGTPVSCPSTGSTGNFCPANGTTGLQVNAVKVVARRTSGSPGGQVKVFWGSVLSLIGSDWSHMSAASQAVAAHEGPVKGPFPICSVDCGMETPLVPKGDNLTPGIRFHLQNPSNPPPAPYIAWTTFYDKNTGNASVVGYVLGDNEAPSNLCGNCVMTSEGVQDAACSVRQRIYGSGSDYTVGGQTIHGWKVLLPILLENSDCPGGKNGCVGNPGSQTGDPYRVAQYAWAIVTDARKQGGTCNDPWPYPTGGAGLVIVGTGPGGIEADGTPYSTIQCMPCDDPTFANPASVKLVK
jgi:Flp pilus assembly protein TadG